MRFAALAALLVAGAIAIAVWKGRASPDDPAEEPPAPPPFVPAEGWGKALVHSHFEIQLPSYWLRNSEQAMRYGWRWVGPEDDGHTPNMQLYWGPWGKSPQEFFRHERERRVPGIQDIVEEGEATVAGMPARYAVYEQTAKDPRTGKDRKFLTIDWYFARDGHGGILRGLATARTFRWRYRALYTEAARRLVYFSQPR